MEYDVIYSGRRTLSLQIKEGRLIIRAPYRTSQREIESAIREHAAWIEKHISEPPLPSKMKCDLSKSETEELRRAAKDVLKKKTDKFSEIMGITYGRIRITNAKTRFGSCSSEGNISYSLRLMQYPEEAIDYVVVHELAHIRQMNHSREFYKIIESVMPDYKLRRKLLK